VVCLHTRVKWTCALGGDPAQSRVCQSSRDWRKRRVSCVARSGTGVARCPGVRRT
jgi:hypothetical protein